MKDSSGETMLNQVCNDLDRIRERHPLVHNITNYVVMNFTANALLALGASPIMAHAAEEMDEMLELAGALVLNIGTLSAAWVDSMFHAATAARRGSVPIVLDPVGAGATRFRTETARRLIMEARPSVIRGNASEILSLAGHFGQPKGVDAVHDTHEAAHAASALARSSGAVVAVTGHEDLVTDGVKLVRINNGHPLMGRVTGTGCAATAIVGAFCAVESDMLIASVGALLAFGVAGEQAARTNPGPGTYQMLLLDALDGLSPALIGMKARIAIGDCTADQ